MGLLTANTALITEKKSVQSCHDFELDIPRRDNVEYKYSYPSEGKLKGIVFIIPGFGDDSNLSYSDNLREYIAEKFSVIAVNVYYHCFYSRVENGAKLTLDASDKKLLHNHLDRYNIAYQDNSYFDALSDLDDKLDEQVQMGAISEALKHIVTMTLAPQHDEYQNFGVMQALDHLNVLKEIESMSLNFDTNCGVTLMGSSHGGYLAYLIAKLAPHKIDCVIDNSAYVQPPLNYIVGKEKDLLNSEYRMSNYRHIQINCFVKTLWTLDPTSEHYFSDDRFRIRNIADTTHLESMASTSKNRTKYIAYHSASDTIAPLSDKVQLYASLNELGFETNLHVIKEDSIVDEKFIKTRKHGMGMSLKRLADKELPNALDISLKKREENSEIIYPCDTLEYRFLIDGQTYIGTSKSFGKDERSVEKIAEQTYLKNIAYLEKYQPEVYEKLAAFDSALAQNLYQSKYDLVHHNDYFDVVELSTGNRLYDSNSDDYANLAMKSVNLQKDFNVYETFKKVTVKESQLEALAKLDITENNLSALAPILHYVEQHKTPSNQMQSIEKFIFLGVGLGGHIMEIDKKINAKVYLIVEDDIELFRLSLFCTPYYTLAAKSELVFSVFDTPSEFIKPASKFLESHYYYNHYLKYFHMLNHSEEKLQEFHIRVASQSHNLFFYNAILQQYLKPLSYLNQNYNFLNILKPYGDMALGNQPVILLAAGPSLQQNIEWIKVNQDKFIIVALSATLSILEKEKIKPDIVTHIDGFDESIAHFKKLDSLDFLSKTIFLMSARTPDEIIEDLPKENIFFFENGTSYKKEFGNLSAPCVGSITYLLLLAFDIKTLYLLGLDLALDNRGATHSDGHEYTKQLDLKNIDTHEDTLVYKNSVLKVAGNFQEEVFTTPDFKTSIDSINATSVGFKKENQYIYNLSNGALFENSIATPVEQCDLSSAPMIAKEKLYKEMHKDFTHNSDMHLTKDEFLLLQQRYAHAQFVKETILTQQKRYFHTSEDFLNSLTTLLSKIASSISVVQYDLALVYQEYCRFIYTFIFDFFNTQELPSNEKYMNDLNALLSEQLLRIVNKYEQELHTIVKVQEK